MVQDIVDCVRVILRFEWSATSNQFVESDPNCPTIDLLVVTPTKEHFGCSIILSPCHCQHLFVSAALFEVLAHSEVNDLNLLRGGVEEDILRLNITVAHVVGMHVSQCF